MATTPRNRPTPYWSVADCRWADLAPALSPALTSWLAPPVLVRIDGKRPRRAVTI